MDPLFHSSSSPLDPLDASDPSDVALEAGVVLAGKYRLLRPAGFGGMGAVWAARNEATGAEVAVKILFTARPGKAAVDDEVIERFRREAYAAAQLYHRGIVRVFDLVELSFEADGDARARRLAVASVASRVPDALLLVMELLRGDTLAAHLARTERMSLEETLAIALPLLSSLAHAHAHGIVHRDLKPDNVFLAVEPDGHVIPKILDFGISKLLAPSVPRITTDGAMLGTPNYMSPEQARGLSDVDARADVFSAGILLYECLAGVNPFASGSYHAVVAAILERDPRPLTGLSPAVWGVLKRALDKEPRARFADGAELLVALREAAGLPAVSADASGGHAVRVGSLGDRSVPPAFREPEFTVPSIFAKRRERRRWGIAVAGGVLLAGVVGFYARSASTSADAGALSPLPVSASSASSVASSPPAASTADADRRPRESAAVRVDPPAPSAAAPEPPPRVAPLPHAVATEPRRGDGPKAPRAPAPVPPPAPSAKSSVVRDPGF